MGVGVWVAPESVSAAVEGSTIEMRLENGGTTVRVRGAFTAKEAFSVEKLLFTAKAAYRPSAGTWIVVANASTGTPAVIQTETNGENRWKVWG